MKKFFVINFEFFSIGGQTKNFEKSKYGKLIFIDNTWVYVLADTKKDFTSLVENIRKMFPFWRTGHIVVETENIINCLAIFLSYIRCGYCYKDDNIHVTHYNKVIDERIDGRNPILNMNFNNWPIKIKNVEIFSNCESINKEWKEKGVLVCCDAAVEGCISTIDMCPIGCHNSGFEDEECLPSAYVWTNNTQKIIQKIDLYGQRFDLIEIKWDRK